MANGSHVITAGRDAAGKTTSAGDGNRKQYAGYAGSDREPHGAGSRNSNRNYFCRATATDNTSVVGVQFLLDGVALGAGDQGALFGFLEYDDDQQWYAPAGPGP